MKNVFTVFLLLLTFQLFGNDGGHKITITTNNYANDTLITGYYFADRQLVHDTLIGQDGIFILEGEEALVGGMYLAIFKPANDYVQFMVNEKEQHFDIKVDFNDLQNVHFQGSKDNDIFYEYVDFIKEKTTIAQALSPKEGEEKKPENQEKLQELNRDVRAYQNDVVAKHPNTVTSKLLMSNFEIDIPEYEGSEDEVRNQKLQYYKAHYFDFVSVGDPVNLRTPYLHQRVTSYVERLTTQVPDSIVVSIDRILDLAEPAEDTYKYYVSHFLNEYAKSNIVGMDAVYVHIVDKYYATGKAPWIDEETLYKLKDNARMVRPTLIGKKAQDITVFAEDSTEISLYDIEAKYTVLYFFKYDCPSCKKSTPFLADFYNKYKDQGVKVLTVCTKRKDDEVKKCFEYIKEKGMEGFLNGVDPKTKSRYSIKYNVTSTPKIYILNEDKEILIKNFPAEELENVMEEVIRVEGERNKGAQD